MVGEDIPELLLPDAELKPRKAAEGDANIRPAPPPNARFVFMRGHAAYHEIDALVTQGLRNHRVAGEVEGGRHHRKVVHRHRVLRANWHFPLTKSGNVLESNDSIYQISCSHRKLCSGACRSPLAD